MLASKKWGSFEKHLRTRSRVGWNERSQADPVCRRRRLHAGHAQRHRTRSRQPSEERSAGGVADLSGCGKPRPLVPGRLSAQALINACRTRRYRRWVAEADCCGGEIPTCTATFDSLPIVVLSNAAPRACSPVSRASRITATSDATGRDRPHNRRWGRCHVSGNFRGTRVPGRPGPGMLHLVSDFQKNFSASLLMGDCGADFLKPICRGHWNCNFACGHHL